MRIVEEDLLVKEEVEMRLVVQEARSEVVVRLASRSPLSAVEEEVVLVDDCMGKHCL